MVSSNSNRQLPPDFEQRHREIIARVAPYTVTSPERVYALIESVAYIINNDIPGAFVECGVYRGGSMMAAALALLANDNADRQLYLYDTYEGMPAPGDEDVDMFGRSAMDEFSKRRISDTSSHWVNASIDSVRDAIRATGYPMENVFLIKGMVEDTIPKQAPAEIALLRLDTDWYQSTKHELVELYHRVAPMGVVIIDDYGYFRGARQAVDEFLCENGLTPYLHRVDYTARLLIKDR